MSIVPWGFNFSEEDQRFGPAWMGSLLRATFFEPCPGHPDMVRNDLKYFCIHCGGLAICFLCLSDHHGHHVIQIRRSSYHDVTRVKELEAALDLSLVQTYMINSDRVVFLNERPRGLRHRSKCGGDTGVCVVCGWALLDVAFRFCSLSCKLKGVVSDANVTFAVSPKCNQEIRELHDNPSRLQRDGHGRQISYRKRRRKGIHRVPKRAPLS